MSVIVLRLVVVLPPLGVKLLTDLWAQQARLSYHPWAEIVAIIGFLDGLREDPAADAFVTEDALGRAVAELGG
ncbi:MAG: hypothetical protein ACRDL5_17805 [Solirubrobacteraceae bacterium]